MQLLDLTLDSPAENLALDEALLQERRIRGATERSAPPLGATRVHGRARLIFAGDGRSAARGLPAAADRGAAADERRSGRRDRAGLPDVFAATRPPPSGVAGNRRDPPVRARCELVAALGQLTPGVGRRGTSDLAIGERKFSGNSLRVKRDWLLYHGTLLYRFPLRLLGQCLGSPPRQPDYRRGRSHALFVANLPLEAPPLREALARAFAADEPLAAWPEQLTARLAAEKFTDPDWTYRLL